ncbi:molecular chaperone, partial [Mycobacterium sp. ITM-2017-0098]
IPDSTAALAALKAAPGLPGNGPVVLVDLGASGSSVTVADAGANLGQIGQTLRYPDFSGDAIDQALLDHVLAGVADANDADTSGTAAVGPLMRLRDECRAAKERLSAETAAVVPVELPGYRSDVRVTRPELEQLISGPLDGLLAAIGDTLQRNGIPADRIAAVATVGGGAAIPLVTQRLSERLRAPVVTTPQSHLNIAAGAALVANEGLDNDAPTGMAAAAGMAGMAAADAPTGLSPAADTPTAMGPVADAPTALGPAAGVAAGGALAWSQDDDAGDPLPYTGADYTAAPVYADASATSARPPIAFAPEDDPYQDDLAPLPWYKRPALLFGLAAAAALLAVGGLAITLTGAEGSSGTVTETASTTPSETAPVELPPPVTTVTVGPDGIATTTVSQPPPPPPPSTTTTTSPTSTTSATTTTTTTTTTTAPTTTTTRTTTTQPTTTPPPPTTTVAPPPTTTVAPPPTTIDPPDPIITTVIVPDAGA